MARPVAPAIVIAAHNRPEQLRRLCASVIAAEIAPDTTLVISIDGGGKRNAEVRSVAEHVDWHHGPATVVNHEHLGLVDHFYACGDRTAEFDAIIFLEDDLIVGPAFQTWALAALSSAEDDDRIAGVSLATPFFDGYRHLPFEPVIDGSDGIYAQVPWYDGMAWTAKMWQAFRNTTTETETRLHRSLDSLGDDEWFPDVMRYLVDSNRYYLLPRHAHATNSGAAGAHFATSTDYFQVPLTLRGPDTWRVNSLDDALAVYDDHLELDAGVLKRLVPDLADTDFAVDLLGVRDLTTVMAEHIVTTRRADNATRLWGASMHPLVANLVHNVAGDAIRLAKTSDVVNSAESANESLATLRTHESRGRTPSGRDVVRQLTDRIKTRLTRGR